MSPEQITLLRRSLELVQADPGALSRCFDARLRSLDPAAVRRFPSGLHPDGDDLADTLALVVTSLGALDELLPTLGRLGARHRQNGARAADYRTARAALLGALAELLGDRFTPAHREAWGLACNLLSEAMLQGASTVAR
jgi:hemoglobin-like flavoprotein